MGRKREQPEARFYSLTAKGREYLAEKASEWHRLTRAMGLILGGPSTPEGGEV